MTTPTITLTLGEEIEVRNEGYMGKPKFAQFRYAVAPCKTRKIRGEFVTFCPLGVAAQVLSDLQEIDGVVIEVADDALEAIASPEAHQQATRPPARLPIIAVLMYDAKTAQISLTGPRAPRAVFDDFRAVVAHSTKTRRIRGEWLNLAPVGEIGSIVDALREIEGVEVQVDPSVSAALTSRSEKLSSELDAARERLAETNAKLARMGMSLYPYQQSGVEWLSIQDGAILADDMGLGKTVQALISAPEGAPLLVVSPAVAKGVWVREAEKWRPDLIPVALAGRGSFRWPEPGEMVVTNYDILSDDVGPAPSGVVVVADEAHALKNEKAKRTKRFRAIAESALKAGGKVWLLTATPVLGKPPELWALLRAIDRVPFRNFDEFGEMMGGIKEWNSGARREIWEWGRYAVDPQVAERLKPMMLRRIKTEVLTDLPAKRYRDFPVAQSAIKRATAKQLDAVMRKWDKVTGNPDVLPPFEMLSEARSILAQAKIPCMLELVEEYEEAEEPLVVFSAHRAPIDELAGREGWATITGDTPPEERTRIENAFQAGELRGVAATIQAGGVAITLTRAAHAIFVDLDWTPALNAQAEDRIYRIGQDRGVLITRLIAPHAIDERLAQILQAKQELIDQSINAAAQGQESVVDESEAQRLDALADAMSAETFAVVEDLTQALESSEEYRERIMSLGRKARSKKDQIAEREWQEKITRSAASRRVDITSMDKTRHLPRNVLEEWAAEGLHLLTMADSDRASIKNAMGFSKPDSIIGHTLAARVHGGLSNTEWMLALSILPKYWRQIGYMPDVTEIDDEDEDEGSGEPEQLSLF